MAATNDQILTAVRALSADITAALGTVQDSLDILTARVERQRVTLARLEAAMAVTQDQVDALTARVDAATQAIETGVTDIRADIQAIKDAHPDVDVTALEASVAGLEALDAENPEAPPA